MLFFPSGNNWEKRVIGEYMFTFRNDSLHFGVRPVVKQGSNMPERFPGLHIARRFSGRTLASFHSKPLPFLSKTPFYLIG